MRQGLALRRGKNETNDNLHQVLQLLARSGVAEAAACLNQRTHLSHDIVTELCNLIGQSLEQCFKSSRIVVLSASIQYWQTKQGMFLESNN